MASLVELAVLTVDAVLLPFLIYSYNKATKKLKNIEVRVYIKLIRFKI
jgi:hypothetical protein